MPGSLNAAIQKKAVLWGVKHPILVDNSDIKIIRTHGSTHQCDISEEDFNKMPEFIAPSLHEWLRDNNRCILDAADGDRSLRSTVELLLDPINKNANFAPDITKHVAGHMNQMCQDTDIIFLCGDRNMYQKVVFVSLTFLFFELK